MANVSSINGNPIVPAEGTIGDGALSASLIGNLGAYNSSLGIEHGLYLVTNGQKSDHADYARTTGYVSKNYAVSSAEPYRMMLVAFDAGGSYVGIWDGSGFSTTYNSAMLMVHIDLNQFSSAYPEYNFALNFYNSVIDIEDLYAHLSVVDSKLNIAGSSKKSNLAYSAVFDGVLNYSNFMSGERRVANPESLSKTSTRCVTDVFHVDGTQVLMVSGNEDGFKFAVGGLRNVLPASRYDSGWKTEDFSIVLDEGAYFVTVAKADETTRIAPSEVNLSVIVGDASLVAQNKRAVQNYIYGAEIELHRGYYAVADGSKTYVVNWARSVDYVPRHLTVKTINGYYMVLLAYDRDGEYVGAWNGEGFATTYDAASLIKRSLDVHEVWSRFPQYRYKLDFARDGGAAIDLDNLRNSIELTDSDANNGNSVPSYYVSHMSEKNSSIKSNINSVGKNGDTFVFITDLHWEMNHRNSPALVKNIIDNTNVRLMLCGGDLINTQQKDTAEKLIQGVVKAFDFPTYPLHMAFGNHDSNELNWGTSDELLANRFNTNEIFGLMQKNTSFANTYLSDTESNFYFDRDDSRTRFIFLDSGTSGAYGADAIPNLCTALDGTPDGYHIIIVQHWYLHGTSAETATLTSSAETLMAVVRQYNDRGSYTHSGITYDFASAGGQIVLMLGGHTHYDYIIEKDDSRNMAGVPLVCTSDDSWRDRTATAGTITEQCFDVITLDYTNRLIKCVRIGDGQDRQVSY